MKKAALILATLFFYCVACKTSVHDNGCISRFNGPTPSYLKPGQLDTIKNLFSANGFSTADLEFTGYYSDTATDSGVFHFNQYVSAAPTLNGLPVFFSSKTWYFRNGVYYLRYSYNNFTPVAANKDTAGHQTLPALRSLFFKTYESALYSNNYIAQGNRIHRPGIYYRDSCLLTQLGYIDAAYLQENNLPYNAQWIKVWQVKVQSSPSPMVFVIDSTSVAFCTFSYYPGEPLMY